MNILCSYDKYTKNTKTRTQNDQVCNGKLITITYYILKDTTSYLSEIAYIFINSVPTLIGFETFSNLYGLTLCHEPKISFFYICV